MGNDKIGVIKKIFRSQKQSSRWFRLYPKQFIDWLINNETFSLLYDAWVFSGYKKDLKPSVDRLEDDIGYEFFNVRVVTWHQNNTKEYNNIKHKFGRKVIVTDTNTDTNYEFITIRDAAKFIGCGSQAVSNCVRGNRKNINNYLCVYNEEK